MYLVHPQVSKQCQFSLLSTKLALMVGDGICTRPELTIVARIKLTKDSVCPCNCEVGIHPSIFG